MKWVLFTPCKGMHERNKGVGLTLLSLESWKGLLESWSLDGVLQVPKITPDLKIHQEDSQDSAHSCTQVITAGQSKIGKGKTYRGEVQRKPAQASRVSNELPQQTTLHMYCHNLTLKELSTPCMTPLSALVNLCLRSLFPLDFAPCAFFELISLSIFFFNKFET